MKAVIVSIVRIGAQVLIVTVPTGTALVQLCIDSERIHGREDGVVFSPLTHAEHTGKYQRREDADDGDDDQQFYERKTVCSHGCVNATARLVPHR